MVAMLAVAGGIFTHLVHLTMPHWTIALVVDIVVGAVVGLAMAVPAALWAGRAGEGR
jgi:hypothetical protein